MKSCHFFLVLFSFLFLFPQYIIFVRAPILSMGRVSTRSVYENADSVLSGDFSLGVLTNFGPRPIHACRQKYMESDAICSSANIDIN